MNLFVLSLKSIDRIWVCYLFKIAFHYDLFLLLFHSCFLDCIFTVCWHDPRWELLSLSSGRFVPANTLKINIITYYKQCKNCICTGGSEKNVIFNCHGSVSGWFLKNIGFQRRYDAFSETSRQINLLHSVCFQMKHSIITNYSPKNVNT